MANRAYLVGSDADGSVGTVGDALNYDPGTQILAASSGLIPVLWLSLFTEGDLRHHEADGEKIPTLLSSTAKAKKRLRSRASLLKKALPDNAKQLAAWRKLVGNIPFSFVNVDAVEIWDLDPDGFEAMLTAAVRWFSSKEDDDWEELQAISETSSDGSADSCQFDDPPPHNLHGHCWVREVPWLDTEDEEPPKRKKRRPVEEWIRPATLEKHPSLRHLTEIDYFHSAGKPVQFDWATSQYDKLIDAYFYESREFRWHLSDRGWPLVFDWIRDNKAIDPERYYAQQVDELGVACQEIYWKCIHQRMRALRQYYHCADRYFSWDLMHMTIERELVSQGKPGGFCSLLLQVYEAGHLPCGWEGEYPAGRILVY